ncbi:hypothetical protein NX059_011746 [Plenodomus lindquistii]|nr:hypothetical protein NX059_011746 [Plenodomus lindquistii]
MRPRITTCKLKSQSRRSQGVEQVSLGLALSRLTSQQRLSRRLAQTQDVPLEERKPSFEHEHKKQPQVAEKAGAKSAKRVMIMQLKPKTKSKWGTLLLEDVEEDESLVECTIPLSFYCKDGRVE